MRKKEKIIALLIIAFFKIITFASFVYVEKDLNPEYFTGIANYMGDAPAYIEPVENYYTTNFFSLDCLVLK